MSLGSPTSRLFVALSVAGERRVRVGLVPLPSRRAGQAGVEGVELLLLPGLSFHILVFTSSASVSFRSLAYILPALPILIEDPYFLVYQPGEVLLLRAGPSLEDELLGSTAWLFRGDAHSPYNANVQCS